MQSPTANTPVVKKRECDDGQKSSGKKLVQARLPFKIIATKASASAKSVSASCAESDTIGNNGRKRRLSLDAEQESGATPQECCASKENASGCVKKKIASETEIVILLDDIVDEEEKIVEQERIPTIKQDNIKARAIPSHTPKSTTPNEKVISTPGSAKNKSRAGKSSSSTRKVQIKLPLGNTKSNKRRKLETQPSIKFTDNEIVCSSEEYESDSIEINPLKRPKIEGISNYNKKENNVDKVEESGTQYSVTPGYCRSTSSEESSNILVVEIGGNGTDVPDTELDSRSNTASNDSKYAVSERDSCAKDTSIDSTKQGIRISPRQRRQREKTKIGPSVKQECTKLCVRKSIENIQESTKVEIYDANSTTWASKANVSKPLSIKDYEKELDHGTENVNTSYTETPCVISSSESKASSEEVKFLEVCGTQKTANDESNTAMKRNLTPKQIKLIEQRRRAREEKERRIHEEKLQKQREKEAKEFKRKRERDEREEQRRKERECRDEQRRKEREERDEQKRKEREEKERKRLAGQEAKYEEKRKRNEAKEEELRKKEEERKRKEDADLKAKKAAEVFQKFFKTKRTANAEGEAEQERAYQRAGIDLAFQPFEVKGDMTLAPIRRKHLSPESKLQIDACVDSSTAFSQKCDLYLAELKSGKITPGFWRRISVDMKASDDDVQIIDELDRAGQAIEQETLGSVERFRAKFYKFHENRRPPYYGTWQKKSGVITPRRPFVQDTNFFDYEVDSDLEWEEEEPGESLDGSDDEKEKESEDDDYEVDNEWFVPHGHLSEEELQNEDEVLDANTREAQKAKLQVLQQEFAQEMKKKTEKIKPRLIGCVWATENGNQPALCPGIIWETLHLRAMLCETPPLLHDSEVPESNELASPNGNGSDKTSEKAKPIKLTERMLNDLVRLVHGNHHSKNFLIKEFIAFLEANEESIKSGEARVPIKSIVREKIEDFAEWTITESMKVDQKNKKKNKKRLCWVVSADVLGKMHLENLGLHNTWKYTLQPRYGKCGPATRSDGAAEMDIVTKDNGMKGNISEVKIEKIKPGSHHHKVSKAKRLEITKFPKLLPAKQSPSSHLTLQAKDGKTSKSNLNMKSSQVAYENEPPVKVKKRVPLLMSVARGQQISQPTKNALISEYLKKHSAEKEAEINRRDKVTVTPVPSKIGEIVILD